MGTSGEDRVQQLFLEARKLDADKRREFLDDACTGDPDLRRQVEALLDDDSMTEIAPPVSFSVEDHPERIGNYRILEAVGEGGMGIVYLAEQLEPIRRRVALKLIKWGMDTRQVVARFESERQALALMDHPNIARVLDAGATEQGRPFFVMEYVKGVPITDYCDRHRLTTQERLKLFGRVCEGVQHAHQKGIIHRDIKPSNVLVTVRDGEAEPKIIDFGVAKATEHRLTEKTLFTAMGVLIGTPEYMSPEQAEMTGLDVDTRTDVYSLGVMLYELLVGALPFDPKELRQAGFNEIKRKIREDEPSKPSTRISTLGDDTQEMVVRRRTDLSSLQRELRDDLDWITMKALEKDRTRRYASASELAADIVRHREGVPVVAGPPSTSYRFRKFVGRHRFGVAIGVLLVALLLAGTIGTSIGLIRAVQAEDRARNEAAIAEQVSEFLIEAFSANNPLAGAHQGASKGPDTTAGEMLELAAKRVRTDLTGQPLIQTRLMGVFGATYLERGDTEIGTELMSDALEIIRTHLGDEHPETTAAQIGLGHARYHEGLHEEAEKLIRDAIVRLEQSENEGGSKSHGARLFLAKVLGAQERHEEAQEITRQHLETVERDPQSDPVALARALRAVADTHDARGEIEDAEKLTLRAIELLEETYGPEHLAVARELGNLTYLYIVQGRYDEAEALAHRSMAIVEQFYGPDHIYVAEAIEPLSGIYSYQGHHGKAAEIGARVVEILESVYGSDAPVLIGPLHNLAYTYMRDGDLDRAEATFLRAFDLAGGVETLKHPMFLKNLATTYYLQGRHAESEKLFERALANAEEMFGRHYMTVYLLNDFTPLRIAQGRYDEAEELNQRAVDLARDIHGESHPDLAWTLHLRGLLRSAENRDEEAEEAFRNALAMREEHLPADSPDIADTRQELAEILRSQGRTDEAVELMAASKAADPD